MNDKNKRTTEIILQPDIGSEAKKIGSFSRASLCYLRKHTDTKRGSLKTRRTTHQPTQWFVCGKCFSSADKNVNSVFINLTAFVVDFSLKSTTM